MSSRWMTFLRPLEAQCTSPHFPPTNHKLPMRLLGKGSHVPNDGLGSSLGACMSSHGENFVELMDRYHPRFVYEMLQPDGAWKPLPPNHLVSMNHGPDGNSLLCGVCASFAYVGTKQTSQTLWVTCPRCDAVYKWSPREVLCACPDHDESQGCSNTNCWKRDLSGG